MTPPARTAALPALLVRAREWMFTRMNGGEGVPVPGPLVGPEHFHRVYADPAANGRSQGAGLSDLFWYWLAPGPQMHQEHLEPGERYRAVARVTRQVLAVPQQRSYQLARDAAARRLGALPADRLSLVRLRDLMMPVWAEVYYELVFALQLFFGAVMVLDARRLRLCANYFGSSTARR